MMRAFAAAAAFTISCTAHCADIGINLYGLSYHVDQEAAQRLGHDNEINPGLGLRFLMRGSESYETFVDVGFFRDSGRNTAALAGLGALLKAGGFRAGGALTLMHSETYMHGDPFIAPIPVVGYDFGRAMLNFTYFPKMPGTAEAFGAWLTIWTNR